MPKGSGSPVNMKVNMNYVIEITNPYSGTTMFESDNFDYSGTSREICLVNYGKKKIILLSADDRVVIEEKSDEEVPF